MPVYELQGKRPELSIEAFIHPEAVVIGNAVVGAGCFVGPGAVIRADFGSVTLGDNVSLQDNAVIHVSPGLQVVIEDDCIIGHGALLHDVRLGAGCVIGAGAILLSGVVCGKGAFVAAGSLVPEGRKIPASAMAMGSPARVVKRGSTPEQATRIREGVRLYRELAESYKKTMKPIP